MGAWMTTDNRYDSSHPRHHELMLPCCAAGHTDYVCISCDGPITKQDMKANVLIEEDDDYVCIKCMEFAAQFVTEFMTSDHDPMPEKIREWLDRAIPEEGTKK